MEHECGLEHDKKWHVCIWGSDGAGYEAVINERGCDRGPDHVDTALHVSETPKRSNETQSDPGLSLEKIYLLSDNISWKQGQYVRHYMKQAYRGTMGGALSLALPQGCIMRGQAHTLLRVLLVVK